MWSLQSSLQYFFSSTAVQKPLCHSSPESSINSFPNIDLTPPSMTSLAREIEKQKEFEKMVIDVMNGYEALKQGYAETELKYIPMMLQGWVIFHGLNKCFPNEQLRLELETIISKWKTILPWFVFKKPKERGTGELDSNKIEQLKSMIDLFLNMDDMKILIAGVGIQVSSQEFQCMAYENRHRFHCRIDKPNKRLILGPCVTRFEPLFLRSDSETDVFKKLSIEKSGFTPIDPEEHVNLIESDFFKILGLTAAQKKKSLLFAFPSTYSRTEVELSMSTEVRALPSPLTSSVTVSAVNVPELPDLFVQPVSIEVVSFRELLEQAGQQSINVEGVSVVKTSVDKDRVGGGEGEHRQQYQTFPFHSKVDVDRSIEKGNVSTYDNDSDEKEVSIDGSQHNDDDDTISSEHSKEIEDAASGSSSHHIEDDKILSIDSSKRKHEFTGEARKLEVRRRIEILKQKHGGVVETPVYNFLKLSKRAKTLNR